tara:strand:- start:6126 stop:6548 length:423 start_codon:yes stop_codon:yes gene_type:complete
MSLNLESKYVFAFNPKVVRKQFFFQLLWTLIGLTILLFTPYCFVSYFIIVLAFLVFLFFRTVYKGSYINVTGHQFYFGKVYKTKIDLRDATRFKSLGQDFIIKTGRRNFRIRTKYLTIKERKSLFNFFLDYSNAYGVIFP